MAEWNPRINLTGARDAESRVLRLVAGIPAWAARLQGPRVLDIGSGNGSPGLVLATLRPDLVVTLLEPRMRRWAFLCEAIRATGAQAEAVRARHDGYAGAPADAIVLRALQLEARDLWPLLRPGGQWVQVGAAPASRGGFQPEPGWAPDVHVSTRCFT
ncbi:MAG: 16S rRNA (guanine(527)-N(7))-methyltransferase RsmG [Vicinamibacteria bacterium]|nr:16S rRNA (guanine(527)-N(7))-methyltransferase RsmG [Vicinamibacteria bacterium]